MSFIRTIELYTALLTLLLSILSLLYHGEFFSLVIGGIFALAAFHSLSIIGASLERINPYSLITKLFLRGLMFYGFLLLVLSSPGSIDPITFALGSSSLPLSILVTNLFHREAC